MSAHWTRDPAVERAAAQALARANVAVRDEPDATAYLRIARAVLAALAAHPAVPAGGDRL